MTECLVYFSKWYDGIHFQKCSRFPIFFRISSKSSDFSCFNHISWHNALFTSQKWYDEIRFRKCVRFSDFFPDFIFWFQWFKSIFLTEYLIYVFINYFPDFFWRNFCCNTLWGVFVSSFSLKGKAKNVKDSRHSKG